MVYSIFMQKATVNVIILLRKAYSKIERIMPHFFNTSFAVLAWKTADLLFHVLRTWMVYIGLKNNIKGRIRGDVKIHNSWLQPECCSIQQLCIAFPI